MKGYELPADPEGMTPAEARKAANQFRATVLSDRESPYNNGGHPQHEDFVAYFRALHVIIRQDDADTQADTTAAELEDALGDEKPCRTRAEVLARIAALLRTPGYVTRERGESPLTDGDRERVRRKVHALSMLVERGDAEGQRIAAEERAAARQEADGDADADADADADDGDGADAGGDADAGGEAW